MNLNEPPVLIGEAKKLPHYWIVGSNVPTYSLGATGVVVRMQFTEPPCRASGQLLFSVVKKSHKNRMGGVNQATLTLAKKKLS